MNEFADYRRLNPEDRRLSAIVADCRRLSFTLIISETEKVTDAEMSLIVQAKRFKLFRLFRQKRQV
uniref:Uncharacterized protein n=1 Tax=Romanomermis culicivorax TaxID=13658 RepID=A0A915J9V0_ROMCU